MVESPDYDDALLYQSAAQNASITKGCGFPALCQKITGDSRGIFTPLPGGCDWTKYITGDTIILRLYAALWDSLPGGRR